MAHCVAELGGLDILVNNAATNPVFGPVVTADPAAVAKTWQTNQEGPAALHPGGLGRRPWPTRAG